jgi:hypothetical protein
MSATWQQSSRNNPAFAERDPFNQLLWRQNVRRLEFEPLRDSILSIGGGLDLAMGGHPVSLESSRVAQGRGAGPAQAQRAAEAGLVMAASPRRSVYGFIDRGDLADVLTTFDVATPNAPTGKRFTTTVPPQALFLMNSPLVIEQVRRVVARDTFQNAASDDDRIKDLYELFFQRLPTDDELRLGRNFVATFQPAPPPSATGPIGARAGGAGRGAGARGGAQGRGRGAAPAPAPVRVPLSVWQEYAHALLLTNEAVFVQ